MKILSALIVLTVFALSGVSASVAAPSKVCDIPDKRALTTLSELERQLQSQSDLEKGLLPPGFPYNPPKIQNKFTGDDAVVFLEAYASVDAVAHGRELGIELVVDVSSPGVPGGTVFFGTEDCLTFGFVGPIEYLNALEMVKRHRAGKAVSVAELEEAAARGDAEAQTHLGIRKEIENRGTGRTLLTQAAEKNVGLAMIALGYWAGALDWLDLIPVGERQDSPRPSSDPVANRALGYCWLNVAAQSTEPTIRNFASSSLKSLWEDRLTDAEKEQGSRLWEHASQNLAQPSCR